MTDDTQRTLGEYGAQIETLQRDISELRGDVRSIMTTLAEARGSWRTLVMVGGMAGAVGAVLTKLASWAAAMPLPR